MYLRECSRLFCLYLTISQRSARCMRVWLPCTFKCTVINLSNEFACNLPGSATRSCPVEHIFETPSDRVVIKETGFSILCDKIVAIAPLSCVDSSKHEHRFLSLVNNETKIRRIGRISPWIEKTLRVQPRERSLAPFFEYLPRSIWNRQRRRTQIQLERINYHEKIKVSRVSRKISLSLRFVQHAINN